MNTKQVAKNVKLVSGGIALLSAAGLTYAISRQIQKRKLYKRPFNPANIVDIEGDIKSVEQSEEKKEEAQGVYINLATDGKLIPVHLGPAWFINHQNHSLKTGDKVQVRGSKTNFQNHEIVTAVSVIHGDEELKLRDEKGTPYWNGWRKVKA